MKLSVIFLSLLVATPAFATYKNNPHHNPPPPPIETPEPTPAPPHVKDTPKSDSDPYVSTGPQYWTGTCKLTEDGHVIVHTAASLLKLFNPEKAHKLAAQQCVERLRAKRILQ